MSWNEPKDGGPKNSGDKPKNPWQGNRQGPPDLDEALKKLQNKLKQLFSGKKPNGAGPGKTNNSSGSILTVVLGALVVLWFVSGIYSVQQAEQAVVLRFGKFHGLVGAGLQWRPRFIDTIEKVNTERVRTHSHGATILTQDKNIVDIKVEVQYRVINPKNFVLKIQDPLGTLAQSTESALRYVVGGEDMDNVITEGRHAIAQQVRERTQNYLDAYSAGVEVTKVNIEDAHPPNEVKAAFDDVVKAKEDEERLKNEAQAYANAVIPESRGHATRQREEAEAYRQEVISRSQGEAIRFSRLLVEYQRAPEVTRQRLYIETMESVLSKSSKVMVSTKGNNMLYLPLDKLMKPAGEEQAKTPLISPVEKPTPAQATAPNLEPNRFGRGDR